MKAIRMAAFGVALLAGSSAIAGAQAPAAPGGPSAQQGGGGGGGGRRSNLNGITLTEAQQAKATEINAKYQPELQAIRESFQNGGDRAEGMKKMAAIRAKLDPELRAILTAEQQVIFDKNVEERKARDAARAAGGGQ